MRLAQMLASAALATCLAFGGGSAHAESDPPPHQIIRDLERLQDRIASGDAIAAAAHAAAIARATGAFTRAKPTAWRDPRNARALVLYLFSGGNAAAIAGSISRDLVARDDQALYEGALAYGLGDDDHARQILLPIDAKSLPSNLGGHLALVQATLLAPKDKAQAIEHLDLARLLEPGTLVEEAALRKEMLLIDVSHDDLDRFALLARRYSGNFSHSVYAGNYHQLILSAAESVGAGNDVAAGARLNKIVGVLPASDRCRLLLKIAHDALLDGRVTMAGYSSDQAGRLARKGSADEARAMTYFGAASVVGDKYDMGRKALDGTAVSLLDDRDRALRQSAFAVADMIRSPAFAKKPAPDGTRTADIADAERALAASSLVLKQAGP